MALRHDAFISYSHSADGKLAAALERGLEKLAKPLLKLRALDVFRDQTSLTASPALWPGIVSHLSVSEWFLLLACPASAASIWCNKEVQWWLDHRSPERLLVLLTEGDIAWNSDARDFDWSRTTAIPRVLAGRCADEPLYVDLRWARTSELLSLRSAQFRDAVVNVAAPIRGVPKDELDGADLKQLTRNRLLVRGGVAAIIAAAGVASWQAIVANQQKVEAERQRDIAIARQLAAQAELMHAQQPDRLPLTLLMATESVRLLPDSIEAQQTLRAILSQFPRPKGVLPHSSAVNWAVFSDDMTQAATAAGDGKGVLWRLADLTPIAKLNDADHVVVFSPDGRRVIGCCRSISVWDRAGRPEFSLSTSELRGRPESISVSADGRLLAIGLDAGQPGFAVYDLQTRQQAARYHAELSGAASAIAFAPNGDLLFAPRQVIQIHSGEAFELTQTLDPELEGSVRRLAIDAAGSYLAASSGTNVTVFDLATKNVVARLDAGNDNAPGAITELLFDAKGRYLGAVGDLNAGRVWRTGVWREAIVVSHGEFQSIRSLSFNPSADEVVSCGTDGSCVIWSLTAGRAAGRLSHSHAFAGGEIGKRQMLAGVFAPRDSVLLTGGADGSARLWEVSRPGEAGRMTCRMEDILVRTFISDVRSWSSEGAPPRLVHRHCSPALPVNGNEPVTLSPTGRFAAVQEAVDTVRVWDTRAKASQTTLLPHTDPIDWEAVDTRLREQMSDRPRAFKLQVMKNHGSVSVLAVSPTGRRVATFREADRTLRIWDGAAQQVLHSEVLADAPPLAMEFISDARMARLDSSGRLSVQAVQDSSTVWSVEHGPATALTLTTDGRRIAAAADAKRPMVRVWDVESGKLVFEQAHEQAIGDLAFDPGGRYLAAQSVVAVTPGGLPNGVGVTVWDVEANRAAARMPASERIIALAFSRDGEQFAAAGHGGDIRVWNLASDGPPRSTVTTDPGPLAFSSTGEWLAVGARSIRVLETNSLRAIAQIDVGGEIRAQEFRDDDSIIAVRRHGGRPEAVIELHRWKTGDLLSEACRRLPLATAQRQWKQLMGEQGAPEPCVAADT